MVLRKAKGCSWPLQGAGVLIEQGRSNAFRPEVNASLCCISCVGHKP